MSVFVPSGRQGILAAVCLVLVAAMAFLADNFLTIDNLLGLTRHLAEVGIIACGMTLIVMSGGIDLSVGSILGLCGVLLGHAWIAWGWGAGPGILLAIAAGIAAGSLNGLLVAGMRFPPLVVTLATMALYRGLAMGISRAAPISDFPAAFSVAVAGQLGPLPVQLLVWIAVAVAAGVVAARTRAGRYVMAIGDNERAAIVARLPVRAVTFALYAASGALCALAAIIWTARFSTAKADAGEGLELQVITAVVLGGTPITGGRGTLLGTFLGVLTLGVIRNGLSLAGVSTVWQAIVAGAILIATAVLNERLVERTARRVDRTTPRTTPRTS